MFQMHTKNLPVLVAFDISSILLSFTLRLLLLWNATIMYLEPTLEASFLVNVEMAHAHAFDMVPHRREVALELGLKFLVFSGFLLLYCPKTICVNGYFGKWFHLFDVRTNLALPSILATDFNLLAESQHILSSIALPLAPH